ncbi:raffinose/stachyose/melibiose transport system permease protein [Paenibacillus sp. V4I3]|uniref:carbohydrate ABC transporter permease n=1 Tax=Paenibacillus sp. V4I3 TaxID=3042305 RepID=UPI0027884B1D|nr:sugar ABC transporter permease [Paenibacillus sp. V4I3]MDQ0877118.1 raffinose/stachyose/melibiose transport system permease protein [Paenibacillus sp. V4I3]
MSYSMQKKLIIIAFLALPVFLLLLLLMYPTVKLVQLSLTDWNGISRQFHYVGFDNYVQAFHMPEIWKSLYHNWQYFLLHALIIPFEIIVAVFLNAKIRANAFFRSIVFLPYVINGVAVAYVFSYLYNPINGPINLFFQTLGLESWIQRWLSDPSVVNYSLIFVSLWRYCGLHVILFLAGLQSIPEDLYEAARMDGASPLRQLWHITIPGMSRVIEIVLFLNVRGALQVFDIPFLMTQGGPGNASSTFTLYTVDTAFKFNNYGLASTMAILLMLMIIGFSYIQKKLFQATGGGET